MSSADIQSTPSVHPPAAEPEPDIAENTFPAVICCATCGAHAYADDRYCLYCGGTLQRWCGKCGADIKHRIAYYCAQCGIRLTQRAM